MPRNPKACLQANSPNYAAEYASSRQNPFDINMNERNLSDSKANYKRRGLFALNGVLVLE
jgi:hypothetical protein